MLSRLVSLTDLVVIAHRGGSKLRPENTMAAFDHAVSLGVDGLECDVHLSRDGELVIIHDPTLDRTTNGTGPVAALGADELRGLGVPRLSDLLARHTRLPIVIEMKGDDPAIASRTVDVVRAADAGARVILAGFSQAVVAAARRLAPEWVTSASRSEAGAAIHRADAADAVRKENEKENDKAAFQLFQVPYRLDGKQQFGQTFVAAARRAGLPVQAWIVDEPDDMRRLIDWGVTGIISDRPDVALKIIG